jgi:GNAT superfamily N-acetyltransferase
MIRSARTDELDVLVAIDDDAGTLYASAGLPLSFVPTHPFAVAERERWSIALERGSVYLALDDALQPIGFAALDVLDGAAYLDQLSVRVGAMRRGVGGRLLRSAVDWACSHGLPSVTLTTYAHLPFNRPFYERLGFRALPVADHTPGLAHHLEEQRRYLPLPEQRIAMVRDLRELDAAARTTT